MGKGNIVHSRLQRLQKQWTKAEARESGQVLDDNDYVAKPSSLQVNVSKSDRLQVVTKWTVTEGPCKGQSITRYDGIDEEVGMSFFKGYAAIVGIDVPDDLIEMPDALEEFMDNNQDEYNITVKTKEGTDFTNIYVKGVVDDGNALDPDVDQELDAGSDGDTDPDNDFQDATANDASDTEVEIEYEEGQRYKFKLDDDEIFYGTVVSIEKKSLVIDDDDDETYEIKFKNIESAKPSNKRK